MSADNLKASAEMGSFANWIQHDHDNGDEFYKEAAEVEELLMKTIPKGTQTLAVAYAAFNFAATVIHYLKGDGCPECEEEAAAEQKLPSLVQ